MIDKTLPAGLAGEKILRAITGTNEVYLGLSAVATGAGAGLGYIAGNGTVLAAEAVGLTTVATIAAGGIALIRSLFD
ncbi:hypothetical protein EII18_10425 [Comamonadaceae bacterium OH3737_COT-264]|nr:hypothetical protein EII18_10425 [Comamonadaceae bacterium OH3737_COT-264]